VLLYSTSWADPFQAHFPCFVDVSLECKADRIQTPVITVGKFSG